MEEKQEDSPKAVVRITVGLVDSAADALNELVARTGLNKTDVVNRALQIYNYVDRVEKNDGALYVREEEGGELQRWRIL